MDTLSRPALEVITGPMFSGKSDELIRRLTLCKIANLGVIVIKPERDTRCENVSSRNGRMMDAVTVSSTDEILALVEETHQVIGIDEIQFFDSGLVSVVLHLVRAGKHVVVSGLNLDFKEEPFENTMRLMALSSSVTVLKAVCDTCRSFEAVRSQRLVETSDRILVGDKQYGPRCLSCYVPSL